MTWKIRAACAALALGLCASAGAKTPLVAARFERFDTLLLEFRESMRNWDNAVRTDLVRTTPALPATCSWDSDTRLNCHLGTAPAPATRYRIDVAAGLVSQRGAPLGARTVFVETARPRVSAGIARWNGGLPRIEIGSDQDVDEASLRESLRLSIDGEPVVPALTRAPPAWRGDTRMRFILDLPARVRGDAPLTLTIRPGLRSRSGPLGGQQDEVLLRARLNTPFQLLGVACAGVEEAATAPVRAGIVVAACTPDQPVHLVFSQAPDAATRARIARIAGTAMAAGPMAGSAIAPEDDAGSDRASPFDAPNVPSRPAHWLRIGQPGPSATIDFDLDSDVRSVSGTALAPVSVRIRTGEAQPQLRSRQSALVADGAHVPPLVEAINVGEMTFDIAGLGLRSVDAEVVARSPRQGSQPQPVPSGDAARVLAEGGWVRWTPQQDSAGYDWRLQRSVEFAAPAFDLVALSGRREVLAWANEWDRDAPVAGALIELLWREPGVAEPRVVATGRTGADGTVLLKLPEALVLAEADDSNDRRGAIAPRERAAAMWMLRAAQDAPAGARRSVLPMDEVEPSGGALGGAAPRKAWGVSDRPMYRAGDTVHYRLWQRELDGVQLRVPRAMAPTTLRLQGDADDKVVLEWPATPAADGSFAGELQLPVHLTDGTYCLGVEAGYSTDGICFFVGTYRAQDLWVEARSRGGVVRDGERFVATARAGYFSGGAAADAELTRVAVSLYPESPGTAYPQFAAFTFIDVDDDDTSSVELAGLDDYERLDGNGEARLDVPVSFAGSAEEIANRPAFGVLATELEASPQDREGTAASEQATRYARYDRYVGLRSYPDWFDGSEPVSLEAVVITAQGGEVRDARVEVSIDFLDGFDWKQAGTPVARCVLHTRERTPCAFARQRTGFYRLTARSDGAAPAAINRYVWWRGSDLAVDAVEPELTVLAEAQPGVAARLLLKQPYARARALVVVSYGGSILAHRVETIEGNVRELTQARAKDWPGVLEVQALVREVGAPPIDAGFRKPARTEWVEAWLAPFAADTPKPPLDLRFATAAARPGTKARITLHNATTRPRTVALSVMDDALRAQAQRWLPYADPLATGFRESLLMRGAGSIRRHDYGAYDGDPWRWLLPWPDAKAAATALRERAQAVMAAPAPAPVMVADGYADSTTLDRIEVTGSRIRRADLVETREAHAPDPSLRLSRERSSVAPGAPAAVRAHFADTALWLPDVQLAPGETREIEVELPDNLTRWRAVAWSADSGADFAMAEAALDAGLPVEVRLQAPVRIYPGDTTRVATSVRHIADAAATARTALAVHGDDDALPSKDDVQALSLTPRGQGSVATVLQPQATGVLALVASARTDAGSDAVAGSIEVASPLITTHRRQAGWIGEEPLHLALPTMPDHAHAPALKLALLRGGAGPVSEWTRDLRDYPHRCWEQILSRAVGAALALERADAQWPAPEAEATVREALDNAAVFQLADGGFVYFPGGDGDAPDASIPLTAYTLRAFALLRSLGHPVPDRVEAAAREFLADVDAPAVREAADQGDDVAAIANFAFASAEQAPEGVRTLDALWSRWRELPLPVQVASAQAFARAHHPAAARAARRLLESAPRRGEARTLRLARRYDAWMSSSMREQCVLIALFAEHPQLAAPAVRRELLAGLDDLYAGGVPAVDTQTAAYCLMALRDSPDAAGTPLQVRFAIGERAQMLQVANGDARAEWNVGTPDAPALTIARVADADAPASYVAELTYQEDAREARPAAVGLSVDRRHDVLRDGAWKPVQGQTLREGDWVRITLVIRTSAQREFVAVTDDIPGGLQPTDLSLSGVGTADLKRIADTGSGYFATRRLDSRKPKFYAESLPAGQHEVHYFARVGNAGDYLAAPAVAELMYGEATHARTAAARLRFNAAP